MFRELVDNAIKFRSPDRPCRVQVTAAQEGDHWIARVSDNGIGLNPEFQDKAFRMFWQLNGEKTAGVGAGLAICRRIARRHNGDIRFASTNEGTRVELVLPSTQQVH
jgi:signal transduction histidine kinase